MSITLKFFMIKRGLTIEKLALKSNAQTPDDLIAYARSLNIGVTNADESLVKDYFEKANKLPLEEVKVNQQQPPTIEEAPVQVTRTRGKKKAGNNV